MSVDSKTKIYKTCVRPVFTYGHNRDTTTTPDGGNEGHQSHTQEKHLLDKIRNEDIRATWGIQDI